MEYFENNRQKYENLHGEDLETDFSIYLSKMIPDKVNADTLVLAVKIVLQDLERQGQNTFPYISLIPQMIRKDATVEFAREFRKKFNREVLGLTKDDLPDVDYGCKEISPNVIDISDKDIGDVLAALYNASTPVGMGFTEYNPMPWNGDIARQYINRFAHIENDGSFSFSYILGRPIHCTFDGNIVYVERYNREIEEGLAQRAIATCPQVIKNK